MCRDKIPLTLTLSPKGRGNLERRSPTKEEYREKLSPKGRGNLERRSPTKEEFREILRQEFLKKL
jgi:hypothetical protein